jgi:hypothetical protein
MHLNASGTHLSPGAFSFASSGGGSTLRRAPSVWLQEKPRMSHRDVSKAIEQHETGMRGAKGPAAGHFDRGPLFRLDPGRNIPLQGVTQPGVDMVATLREAHKNAEMPPPASLDVYGALTASKSRHLANTSLAMAGRESEGAGRRAVLLAHAQRVVDPDRIAAMLRTEAERCFRDAERIRIIREKKANERAYAKAHGEVVKTEVAQKLLTAKSERQEHEAVALGEFYLSLDSRVDDARNYEAPAPLATGQTTRLQRDFFHYAFRRGGGRSGDNTISDNDTMLAPLPHIDRVVPPPDAAFVRTLMRAEEHEKRRNGGGGAAAISAVGPLPAPMSAMSASGPLRSRTHAPTVAKPATQASESRGTNLASEVPKTLPVLAHYLGIGEELFQKGNSYNAEEGSARAARKRAAAERSKPGSVAPSAAASPASVALVPTPVPITNGSSTAPSPLAGTLGGSETPQDALRIGDSHAPALLLQDDETRDPQPNHRQQPRSYLKRRQLTEGERLAKLMARRAAGDESLADLRVFSPKLTTH